MNKLEPTRTCSNPTATEVLRRLLDERGVEWDGESYEGVTFWNDDTNLAVASDDRDGLLWVSQRLTPEQAIAATLGAGTCHDLAVTPAYRDKTEFKCSECGYEYSAVGGFGCDSGDEPDFNYCPNCGRRIEQ